MGGKNSSQKTEEIIVNAAGTGNNNANQSASTSQELSRTDYILFVLTAIFCVIALIYVIRKMKKDLRDMVRREVHLHSVRTSQASISNV